MKTIEKKMTRFDARLSVEQKSYFEKATQIGGYRSLTDFIIQAAQEKSKQIIDEHERILASNEDARVFFDALVNPPEPNDALLAVAEEYQSYKRSEK